MRHGYRSRGSAVLLAVVLTVVGLELPAGAAAPGTLAARAEPRVRVAAGFFPLAAVARSVGGSAARVSDLTPPGVDAHDLEPTSDQVDRLLDADLAIVLGESFQPAVERLAERRDGPTIVWRDLLDDAAARRLEGDPHVWLDPVRLGALATRTGARLARLDPGRAGAYRRRAAQVAATLDDLDARYRTTLASCERALLVTSHESFGWLTERYGLEQTGVTRGAPDAEPDPARVADLADRARREGVTTVFAEPLVSDRVARTVAREAGGLRVVELDPLEGLRGERASRGDVDDYVRIMDRNLERIADALGCG